MLTRLGMRAREWMGERNPWTNMYGVARSLLALATAATLAANHTSVLFQPAAGRAEGLLCDGLRQSSLFCLVPRDNLEAARWLAVVLLLVVASGWRPRLTALWHAWLSFSFQATASVVDGGDQAALVLSLLMLPVALTDRRRWHWWSSAETPSPDNEVRRLAALAGLLALRLQVAAIYLHASIGKLKVEQWADGTAVYYWFTDSLVGGPDWLIQLLWPVLTSPAVVLITWGSMVLEFMLFMALTAGKKQKRVLLVLGIAFHFGIILMHGLVSFASIMFAALILLLRPPEDGFTLPALPWRSAAPEASGVLAPEVRTG